MQVTNEEPLNSFKLLSWYLSICVMSRFFANIHGQGPVCNTFMFSFALLEKLAWLLW